MAESRNSILPIPTSKLSKVKKKMFKRREKTKIMLCKHAGIETTKTPTPYLVVGNCGLTTGATQEELLAVFTQFGNIKEVIMVPDKQYSFIKFSTVKEAENAFCNAEGMEIYLENGMKMTMCLAFVISVPDEKKLQYANDMPPGLILLENFISESYENELMNLINRDAKPSEKQHLKHRKVKHYGYEFKYDSSTVDKLNPLEQPIPPECDDLIYELCKTGHITSRPDQLTVNQYEPGQGIPPHVDTHSSFEDHIISVSLGSAIVMNFTRPNGGQASIYLPRRSVLIMSEESRYLWSHGIVPRKTDVIQAPSGGLTLNHRGTRISLTFRRVRQGEICECSYPECCDYQKKNQNETRADVEGVYVQQVYDAIAPHFSETRYKPWPGVVEFLQSLCLGSIVVDVGCGNGKYFHTNPHIFHIGCDQSVELIKICHGRHFEVFTSDIVHLSLRKQCADACICIAVIHHLSTEERRLAAIYNLVDFVRPGGKILIYVWAMEQDLNEKKSSYIKEARDIAVQKENIISNACSGCKKNNHTLPQIENDLPFPVHVNRTRFVQPDILVQWKQKKEHMGENETKKNAYYRYYHLFEGEELENLCRRIQNVNIVQSYYDNGNWCVILQKDIAII